MITLVGPLPGGGRLRAIRRTVIRCVHWWAHCQVEAGPELSGGQSLGEYTGGPTDWRRKAQSYQEDSHQVITLVGLLPGVGRPRIISRTVIR